jgi:hypothetical protein
MGGNRATTPSLAANEGADRWFPAADSINAVDRISTPPGSDGIAKRRRKGW